MTGQEIVESMSRVINDLAALLVELRCRSITSGTLTRTVDALEELDRALDALGEGFMRGSLVVDFMVTQADQIETRRLHEILRAGIMQPELLAVEEVNMLGRHLLRVLGVPNVDDLLESSSDSGSA